MNRVSFPPVGQSVGPASNLQNRLLLPTEDFALNKSKIYEINKKYENYIEEFGVKKHIPQISNPYGKINEVIAIYSPKGLQAKERGLKRLYGLTNEDIKYNQLLIDPQRISPLLKALNDENIILREEIDKIALDLMEFVYKVEILINENRAISLHLQRRDQEQRTFTEAIEINKAEDLQDYRFQIQQLQEENNLLVKHLEDQRVMIFLHEQQKNTQDNYINELTTELENSKLLYEQLNNNFQYSKEREENLVRQLSLLQPKYSSAMDQVCELEFAKENLDDQHNKLLNKYSLLENKLKISEIEQTEKIQTQRIQLEQGQIQLDAYKQEKQRQILLINELERTVEDLKKEKVALVRERDEFQQICDQLYVRGKDIKNQLEVEKVFKQSYLQIRIQNSGHKERDTSPIIQKLEEDNLKLEMMLRDAKRQFEQLSKASKEDLEGQQLTSQRILENMKIRYTTSIQSLTDEISQLQQQLNRGDDTQQTFRKELEIAKMELDECRLQLKDHQQLRRIIDGQQVELRQLRLDIQDYKLQLSTLEEKYTFDKQDLQGIINKLQREVQLQNKQLQETHNELKLYISKDQEYEKNITMNLQMKTDLKTLIMENEKLLNDLKVAQQQLDENEGQMRSAQQQIQETQRQIKVLQHYENEFKDLAAENQEIRKQLNLHESQGRQQFRTNIPIVRGDRNKSSSPI